MVPKGAAPLKTAIKHLRGALEAYSSRIEDDPLPFLTVTKAFEIAVEYGWRLLKYNVEDEGLEAVSPKAAVRAAEKLGTISDPQAWLDEIEARNASVHDYFGIAEVDFIKLAERFVDLARDIISK